MERYFEGQPLAKKTSCYIHAKKKKEVERKAENIKGGVGIIIPDRGPVGWLGPQAAKKKLEPQNFRPQNSIDGLASE